MGGVETIQKGENKNVRKEAGDKPQTAGDWKGRYPLVCFEGVDLAGKTTRREKAAEILRKKGYSVFETHFPRKKPDLTQGRDGLLKYFLMEMKEDKEKILEMSREGVVMIDRYFYSTMAYQGKIGDYGDVAGIIKDYELAVPDITFLVDAPPDQLVDRVRDTKRDFFEQNLDFQNSVRAKYLDIMNIRPFDDTTWFLLNGLGEKEENVAHATRLISRDEETWSLFKNGSIFINRCLGIEKKDEKKEK